MGFAFNWYTMCRWIIKDSQILTNDIFALIIFSMFWVICLPILGLCMLIDGMSHNNTITNFFEKIKQWCLNHPKRKE